MAIDASGDLFIADFNNNRIRKVSTNGIITTVRGGGANYPGDNSAATNASLSLPSSVAVDAAGDLFIADRGHNRIRKVDTNGIITTVAGGGANYPGDNGAATNAYLNCSLHAWLLDASNNTVHRGLGPQPHPQSGLPAVSSRQ